MNRQLSSEQVDDLLDYIGVEKRRWKSNMDSVQFCCPVHKERRPSAGLSVSLQAWNCFACGEKGSFPFLLYKSLPDEFKTIYQAVRFIRERYHVDRSRSSSDPKGRIKRYEDFFNSEPVMIAEAVDYRPHNESDIILTDNSMRLRRRDRKRSTIQGTHVTLPTGITQTVSPSHAPMTFEAVAPKEKFECLRATHYKSGVRNFEKKITDGMGYMGVPVRIGTVENNANNPEHDSRQYRVYSPYGKSVTLAGEAGGMGAKTGLYTIPSPQEAAAKVVYKVEAGQIEIKGKLYPIKLPDGYYIIRKLTVTECCRLQTLPDDYCRAVSKTQAYRGLGNGWTAEVIIHLLSLALRGVPKSEKIIVLSMFDGIGTGRYCFDRLGYDNITYYAYETDRHAIEVAMSNYPDIKQCGDAFDVREPEWFLRKRHRRAVKRVVSS